MAKHVQTGSGDALPVSNLSLLIKNGPIQIRIHDCPFNTIGIDHVGQLPTIPTGNKWILTAVCPYSNFL